MTTLRSDADDAARRSFLGVSRGTLVQAGDQTKLQEVSVRARFGRMLTNVEHWHPYGFTSVPLPPTDQQQNQAEVLLTYLGGSPDHPVVISVADRRHRPKNLKPGESSHHDDQGQHTHLTRDGINSTGKKVTITAGAKPATKDFELNEQLKGLAARVAQAEQNLHGLFDATSQLRAIAQTVIPALSVLQPLLNQDPSGLPAMAAAIEGKAQAYLQQQVQQALQMFLNPNLGALTSLLGGGVEGLIAAAQAQIANLIASNPIIGTVDDLVDELTALNASGGPVAAITAKAADLQGQIDALTSANPVIGQIAQLRSALQGLIDQAGPGLNFLAPQQRLTQGQTSSMRFGGPG